MTTQEKISTDREPLWRTRVNLGRSVKMVHTFDVTVECTAVDLDITEVMKVHDELVRQLKTRYPDVEVA
jgi:hypothetical protein